MEASHLLDMRKLIGEYPPNVLIPANMKNKPIFNRSPDRFTFLFMMIAFLFSIYLGFRNNFASPIYLLLAILLLIIYFRKNTINGIYVISKNALIVPYTWLTTKELSFTQIIEISNEKLIDKVTGTEYDGIRITIDNPGLKFNGTLILLI